MSIKQPLGIKKLTNVAIVRYKAAGKRFEIACYKNKVLNWRSGVEKDLSEVLQIDTIFTNVSKGEVANAKDLQKAFNTTDPEDICKKILKSGELQVSDKEREVHQEALLRDIVQNVVERCVHPQTGRQLTALTVENALKRIGFSVVDQPAKRQALKAIEALCKEMPDSFARAKMRLRITCPDRLLDEFRRHLTEVSNATIEEETRSGEGSSAATTSVTFVCDPSQYRELDSFTTAHAGDCVSIQVIASAVLRDGDGGGLCSGDLLAAPARAPAPVDLPDRAGAGAGALPQGGEQLAGAARPQPEPERKKGAMRCSACGAELEDAASYRAHCKSDWHNHNLKRKVKSLPPVSEEDFVEISLDIREGFTTDTY
ncbi:unnamed protein product [Prorocentrum cordatum]|uniref:C2H2-type domain-containing protein n=1 Tax=Prorocentrum cordatum TaxID=2364126 RepID=A0ABN9PMB0_9DINO|nr:unnamed protein product [Polarella glacialis]